MFNDFWATFSQQLTPQMWSVVATATYETVYISFASTLLAVIVGLPVGVWTFLTGKNEILQNNRTHFVLNTIINIGRSIPFIILLLILLPVTRFIVGTVLGTTAAIIPLSICAMPFVARLTANAHSKRFNRSCTSYGCNKMANRTEILFAGSLTNAH